MWKTKHPPLCLITLESRYPPPPSSPRIPPTPTTFLPSLFQLCPFCHRVHFCVAFKTCRGGWGRGRGERERGVSSRKHHEVAQAEEKGCGKEGGKVGERGGGVVVVVGGWGRGAGAICSVYLLVVLGRPRDHKYITSKTSTCTDTQVLLV